MSASDAKVTLKSYLQGGRETLLWKLDGLSEYDIRRPLVPTGTNLLGLVKHLAHSEFTWLGTTFGRPPREPAAVAMTGGWRSGRKTLRREPNAHMWARADESRENIVDLYRHAWAHSDATIEGLELDAVGRVPHWPERQNEVTLHQALVHLIVETQRHAGHADIIRELIDGAVGLLKDHANLPQAERDWWVSHHDRVQRAAEEASR